MTHIIVLLQSLMDVRGREALRHDTQHTGVSCHQEGTQVIHKTGTGMGTAEKWESLPPLASRRAARECWWRTTKAEARGDVKR